MGKKEKETRIKEDEEEKEKKEGRMAQKRVSFLWI